MKTGFVSLNNEVFETLLAISEEEQQKGLMWETKPQIMSFLYKTPKINKFWMHNTPAPLDILFCNNNRITQICYGKPYSTVIIGDNSYSDLIIELPAGSVQFSNIKIGYQTELFKPTKIELIKQGYLQT